MANHPPAPQAPVDGPPAPPAEGQPGPGGPPAPPANDPPGPGGPPTPPAENPLLPSWDDLVGGLALAPQELAHQLLQEHGAPSFAWQPSSTPMRAEEPRVHFRYSGLMGLVLACHCADTQLGLPRLLPRHSHDAGRPRVRVATTVSRPRKGSASLTSPPWLCSGSAFSCFLSPRCRHPNH